MVLSDSDIKREIEKGRLVLNDIQEDTVRPNGVDLRVGDEIKRFIVPNNAVDPDDKDSLESVYIPYKIADSFVLNPNERILVKIKERVEMPVDIVGFLHIRSTFARLGLAIPPTVVDSGFKGFLTVLIVGGHTPVVLKRDMRIVYMTLNRTSSKVENAYSSKYQDSLGTTGAKV